MICYIYIYFHIVPRDKNRTYGKIFDSQNFAKIVSKLISSFVIYLWVNFNLSCITMYTFLSLFIYLLHFEEITIFLIVRDEYDGGSVRLIDLRRDSCSMGNW